jgi:hypothetical protein
LTLRPAVINIKQQRGCEVVGSDCHLAHLDAAFIALLRGVRPPASKVGRGRQRRD